MKRNGNAERRRPENRGAEGEDEAPQALRSSAAGARRKDRRAEGVEGDGVWGGGVPSPPRPPPQKKIDFGSQYGEFWCILDDIFTVQLPVLHAKPVFNRYMRTKAVMVSR